MKSLSELHSDSNLKILLYGDSGTGKTCFAAGMPKPFIADFDGKIVSAAEFLRRNNPEQLKQVKYESYLNDDDKMLAVERFNMAMAKYRKEKPDFETFVLDSLTLFSDESMRYLIKINSGITRKATNGIQLPVLQDYQLARTWFKQMITALLTLPCNVVITAHIQVDKDELTGQIIRSPMMIGKLSQELPIYFGEVWRAYRDDKGEYWAQTQSDSKYNCRSQIPGLPNPVKLDWNVIKNYINNKQ